MNAFDLGPFTVAPGDGTAIWYRGTLMSVKAGTDSTNGALTIIEHAMPAGFAAPPHVHHKDDEPWYVLEGHVRFFCRDEAFDAEPGTFVFLPKDITHSFRVDESAPTSNCASHSRRSWLVQRVCQGSAGRAALRRCWCRYHQC